MFHIIPADEAFTDNMVGITWNVNTAFQHRSIFTIGKAAEETTQIIRELFGMKLGKRLM